MKSVSISATDHAGVNLFPDLWRKDSDSMAALPFLQNVTHEQSNQVLSHDSSQHLVDLLSSGEKYTILATGPMTNIAEAFKKNPNIKRNIKRIYVMGGAVRVDGNVEEKGHDKTADWWSFVIVFKDK